MKTSTAIIIMGVSGCGKSSLGELLAARLGNPFFDGDDYHPAENIAKMSSGQALTDEGRAGWLETLVKLMQKENEQGATPVLACSALKRSYRELLRMAAEDVYFIHLSGSRPMIQDRLEQRSRENQHFMNPALLDSQLETLEDPSGEPRTLVLDVVQPLGVLSEVAAQFLSNFSDSTV